MLLPCRIVGEVYRRQDFLWSGRPGSNRRHLPWQGSTLPLSYSRSYRIKYSGHVPYGQRDNEGSSVDVVCTRNRKHASDLLKGWRLRGVGMGISQMDMSGAQTPGQMQWQALLDSTGEGICGLDLEGNCTFVNRTAVNSFGFETGEMVGSNMH